MALGFLGLALAIAGQTEGLGFSDGTPLIRLGVGIVLATAAAVATSLSAFALRWGADFCIAALRARSREAGEGSGHFDESRDSSELFGVVVALLVASSLSLPLTALIGTASGESIGASAVVTGLIGGAFAGAVPSLCLRKANLIAQNLGVNALIYVAPGLALLWLFLASRSELARPDYLALGGAAIVMANVLIALGSTVGSGMKVLLATLWVLGVVGYLAATGSLPIWRG